MKLFSINGIYSSRHLMSNKCRNITQFSVLVNYIDRLIFPCNFVTTEVWSLEPFINFHWSHECFIKLFITDSCIKKAKTNDWSQKFICTQTKNVHQRFSKFFCSRDILIIPKISPHTFLNFFCEFECKFKKI